MSSSTLSPDEHLGRSMMSRRVLRGFSPEAFLEALGEVKAPELSRRTRISTSTIYAWAHGVRSPQVDRLAAVMQVLGKPISDVVLIEAGEHFPGDWRSLAGLLQPKLAAAAGIPTSRLQKIERGELDLSGDLAAVLAGILGVSAAEYRRSYVRACEREPGTPA
ncbi:helix-turn-helix transcriptional regulator [Mycobacteroides abscessus]|uniref:helix-turn-helix transcriptional regulator n=1 Tax=Mycobacteroides abscessus TaxID=36809 RepID=UPI001F1D203A|nr:helix-turn-helix transcriptional regulator [Mycobacteroides abscessus]